MPLTNMLQTVQFAEPVTTGTQVVNVLIEKGNRPARVRSRAYRVVNYWTARMSPKPEQVTASLDLWMVEHASRDEV